MALQTNTNITRYNYTLKAHYELIPAGKRQRGQNRRSHGADGVQCRRRRPYLYATVRPNSDAKNRAAE